jgi:hypothetical protein
MEINRMAELLSTIQEILVLCNDSSNATAIARERLEQILMQMETVPTEACISEKTRVAQAISDIRRTLKSHKNAWRPTSVMFRGIAEALASKNNLRYDRKIKRCTDLMVWFEENWDVIGSQFQGLLKAELLAKK